MTWFLWVPLTAGPRYLPRRTPPPPPKSPGFLPPSIPALQIALLDSRLDLDGLLRCCKATRWTKGNDLKFAQSPSPTKGVWEVFMHEASIICTMVIGKAHVHRTGGSTNDDKCCCASNQLCFKAFHGF
ncbi:uncharacterized protein LOC135625350 isoform X2 [Musa acuminata AAA Group]|uniref:uncharacterized protein LOC135625350 isoform X2 n=1 Tax=Musa acuminata AAA Group TaxID=214697 RepID=UPI0031DBA75C